MNNTIGTVNECEKEQELIFLIKWKIHNYFSLHQAENIAYYSPPFVFSGATWCLKVYPYGETDNDSVGHVNIYLVKLHPRNENHHIKCQIGIQDSEVEEYDSFEIDEDFGGDECERGLVKFIDAEEFMSFGLSDEFFIIFCSFHMKVFIDVEQRQPIISRVPKSFPSNKQNITNALCQNMKNLFLNQKDCDVILNVSGQEFPAHKIILSARCVVFAHMFGCEMTENLSGRVNIQDVDPNVFKNVLIYIYSGEIEGLSLDSVFEYYNLADKFQLAELREACLEFVESNISPSNVFNLFQLSEKHGDTRLKDIAKQFIAENIKEIIATEGWATLKAQNYPLSVEILELAVHNRN